MTARTIAIGDIHGCARALEALLEAVRPTANDQLIFLGDYVDRGPDSRRVIDILLELETATQVSFLLGNHEIMLVQVLDGAPADPWLSAGGRQTVVSYGGTLGNFPENHREFLARLLPYYESESHIGVHANYLPQLPMDQQPEEVLFWLHLNGFMPEPHYSAKQVLCGHTPQPGGKIGYYGHLTCLDTACFAGYWLTGLELHSGQAWQTNQWGQMADG